MLFYVVTDNISGGEASDAVREWKLEVAPKGFDRERGGPVGSYITVTEQYFAPKKMAKMKTNIKPIKADINWVSADPRADINPPPENTVDFLGCFFFQLFGAFNLDSAFTTDGAQVDYDHDKPLMFIRAFAGKPSIYVKSKRIEYKKAGIGTTITVSTFTPNEPTEVASAASDSDAEPWKRMDYKTLITGIQGYKMADIKQELESEKVGRAAAWVTIVNIAKTTGWDPDGTFSEKTTIGPFMEFLWFGDKGSAAGKMRMRQTRPTGSKYLKNSTRISYSLVNHELRRLSCVTC
eukprot:247831_1